MVTTAVSPAPGDQEPAKIGAMGRVFGVLFNPKETFADIARRPNWVVPVFLLTLVSLALNLVLVQRVDWIAAQQKQIENSKFVAQRFDALDADKRQAAIAQQAMFAKYGRYAAGLLSVTALALIGAGIYLGAFNVFGGAGVGYSKSLALVSFAFIPTGIRDLLSIPVVMMKDPSAIDPQNVLASNLGAFLSPSAPLWQQALARSFDVFSVWCLVLVAIAFAAANPRKLTFGKALGIAITVHVVFLVIGVGIAFIFS